MESVDDIDLVRQMKNWFEEIDYKASGFLSLEKALDDIFQDEGDTVSLYKELKELLIRPSSDRTDCDETFRRCQQWFEAIDYENSGYKSLEEAIADIYQDEGATLELYRMFTDRNAINR